MELSEKSNLTDSFNIAQTLKVKFADKNMIRMGKLHKLEMGMHNSSVCKHIFLCLYTVLSQL